MSKLYPPFARSIPAVKGISPGSIPRSLMVSPGTPYAMVGLTAQVRAIVFYVDGSTSDITGAAAWVSGDTTKATISAAGVMTGVGWGKSTITATYNGLSDARTAIIGGQTVVRTISQPTDGSDFTVTVSPAMPNDSYDIYGSVVNSSLQVTFRFPDSLAGDRTTTSFRCITGTALTTGDIVSFLLVPR